MRLWNTDSGDAGPAFALNQFDKQTIGLINQMLGEGEVSIRITIPNDTFDEIRIQESVYVGVWRVRYFREGRPIADQVEVSAIPSCVAEAAYATSRPGLLPVEPGPEAMNSPAILAELKTALKDWAPALRPLPSTSVICPCRLKTIRSLTKRSEKAPSTSFPEVRQLQNLFYRCSSSLASSVSETMRRRAS